MTQYSSSATVTALTAPAAPATHEVASVEKDIFFPAFGGVLRPHDDTLATRGQGKGLKIYDELEQDAAVFGDLQKRKLAVIAREWQVTAASAAPLDEAAAALIRRHLEQVNFDQLCLNLLDALLKGYAVGEIIWGIDGNEVLPLEVIPREQRRFTFGLDRQLRLLTLANLVQGEELPARKFIVHRCGSKDGNPFGLGLGTRLFWPVYFKRQDIAFWLTFADKFGSPTTIGRYPAGTTEAEKNKFKSALAAIAQDTGIIIPEGMAIELLEAQRSGSTDAYEKLARYMDEQIGKIILGEAESMRSQAGALAAGSIIRNDVRLELTQADSDLLCDTLNRTLIRWDIDYNLPGAGAPRVYRKINKEDLHARADRDLKICAMGYRPSEQYINATYGEGWQPAAPGAAVQPAIPSPPAAADAAPAATATAAPAATPTASAHTATASAPTATAAATPHSAAQAASASASPTAARPR